MCGNIKVLQSLRCEAYLQWSNAEYECLVQDRQMCMWHPYMCLRSIHQLPMIEELA